MDNCIKQLKLEELRDQGSILPEPFEFKDTIEEVQIKLSQLTAGENTFVSQKVDTKVYNYLIDVMSAFSKNAYSAVLENLQNDNYKRQEAE